MCVFSQATVMSLLNSRGLLPFSLLRWQFRLWASSFLATLAVRCQRSLAHILSISSRPASWALTVSTILRLAFRRPPQPGTRPFRHVLPDGRNDPHPLGQRLPPRMVAEHRYPLSPRTYGVADADISRSMAPVHAGGGDAKRGSILMSCVTFIKVISHAGSSSGVMCFSVALTQLSNYFIYDII